MVDNRLDMAENNIILNVAKLMAASKTVLKTGVKIAQILLQ